MSKSILDFADHIGESTTHFTGRRWVFKAINDWLAEPNGSRYFLLTGMPGSGKTTIAARLVQFSQGTPTPTGCDQLTTDVLSAWHFCSARDLLWIDPHVFAGTLASQLAARYLPFQQALWQRRGEDRNITITTIQNVAYLAAGQMTGIGNISVNVGNISPLDAFNRVVREPLTTLYAQEPDTRIVILVDALDEALFYSERETERESIAWLLSKLDNLPKGVRFILTSRRVERIEQYFRSATNMFLSSKSFMKQNLEDTRRYVQDRLLHDGALQAQVSTLSGVQEQRATLEITRKAAGNFLYIRFLLNAIAQGKRSLDQLDGLPKGLDALYFDSLQRVVEQGKGDWYQDYAPLMGVLAVAQESLTQRQVEALTGQKEAAIRQHLGALQQFLERVAVKGKRQEKKYRLYHQSFIDFLTSLWITVEKKEMVKKEEKAEEEVEWEGIEDDEMNWKETQDEEEGEEAEEDLGNIFYLSLQEHHREVAQRCEQNDMANIWNEAEDDPVEQARREYTRKYYVTHLYHGQEWQRLFTVLDEGEYGRAKIKHDFNTLAYAHDLELGQQATMRNGLSSEKKIRLLPALWRYGLLRASLVTQADNYPDLAFLVMVMLKQYRQALAVVELISDDHRKARLFIDIGVKLEEQGQKELAQWAMAQVRAMMVANMQSDPTIVQTILQEIAQVRPFALEIPFLDEIETTTQLIENEEQRASVLVAIAAAFSLAEAHEKAEALACTIPYRALDEKTREKIVETLVEAKLWESATLIAQSITDDQPARNSALAKVIIGLLGVQAWEKARELALTTDLSVRWKAMAEIVLNRVLVEPQMADQLLKELAFIALPDDRKHASRVISQIWARAHQWDKAINTLQHMYDNMYDSLNTWAASQALEQMLRAQQWDKAIELASSLPDSFSQLGLLKSLVEALIDAEQVDRARDAIAKVIRAISRREHDDEILLEVVTLLIKLQLWNEAQQVTEQMKDPKQQCQAFAAIADALSHEQPAHAHQLIVRAESIVSSLKKPDEETYGYDTERIGSILCTVVGVLARMQLWDRAIALANTISARWSTRDRDETFAAIVVASGRAKAWEQAISIAQNIESDEEQSTALKAVVEDLLYSQEWQRALEVTQTIKESKQRFEALIALIIRLIFVQRMSLRERTELPGREDELPSIPFDVQLSEEEEQLWDDIIASVQQLFNMYRPTEAIIEMIHNLAMDQQWDNILKIVDIPALAEHRAEILGTLVGYMLNLGKYERALACARSIDAPAQKAEALVGLAATHIIEEQPLKAEALLNEALTVVQAIPDEKDRGEAGALLAFALNKGGHWEKALAIARSIHEPTERIKVQVNIAVARKDSEPEQTVAILSDALAFVRSLSIVEQVEPLIVLVEAFPPVLGIKQTYALSAEIISLLATLLRSIGEVEPAAYLDTFAGAMASAEQEEQARALLIERAADLDTLAGAMASAEQEEQARAVWTELEATFALWAESEVPTEEQERGQAWNQHAVEDIGEEEDPFGRRGGSREQEKKDQRLHSVVLSSIKNGQPEQAADMLLAHMASNYYFDAREWSTIQRDVAESLARKQQWEKALAIVWSIGREWQKTQALEAIAEALVEAGQRDKARLLLVEAEAKAHSIEDGRERDDALRDVANTLAQIQEPDEAQVVVGFINDSMHREVPRLLITHALAQARRWDEAKEEARRLGFSKRSPMQSITDAMITYGEFEQALQCIQTAWIQAETRRELIKLLPLAKEFIPLHPELGEAFYDAFAWVDHFLQA
jgi:hypothetical protein